MVENVPWIKNGITINVGVSAKIQKKNIIFWILLNLVVKMVNMQKVL